MALGGRRGVPPTRDREENFFCSAQACRRDHLDKQRVSASLIPSPSNPSQRMHKTKSISNCSGECLDRSEGKHRNTLAAGDGNNAGGQHGSTPRSVPGGQGSSSLGSVIMAAVGASSSSSMESLSEAGVSPSKEPSGVRRLRNGGQDGWLGVAGGHDGSQGRDDRRGEEEQQLPMSGHGPERRCGTIEQDIEEPQT